MVSPFVSLLYKRTSQVVYCIIFCVLLGTVSPPYGVGSVMLQQEQWEFRLWELENARVGGSLFATGRYDPASSVGSARVNSQRDWSMGEPRGGNSVIAGGYSSAGVGEADPGELGGMEVAQDLFLADLSYTESLDSSQDGALVTGSSIDAFHLYVPEPAEWALALMAGCLLCGVGWRLARGAVSSRTR